MAEIIYNEIKPERDKFYDLYLTTGWNDEYQRSKEDIYRALDSSWYSVAAYDSDKLVGFGRAISDGVLHALVCEVIVLPEYQGYNIGRRIMEMINKKCREANICDVQLFCATGKTAFYEKLGYEKRSDDAPGMQLLK